MNSQRIVFQSPGVVNLETYPLPDVAADEVLVTTRYSMISIGTESTILGKRYADDSHFARMFSFPQYKTGVLATGTVERLGHNVKNFQKGDPVFMRMAHGARQVLPAAALSPVPASVDLMEACWCGLAKTAFRAAWAGQFDTARSVVIVGAGPVGQMLVRWAAASSVDTLAVVDPLALRVEAARRGGATHALRGRLAEFEAQLKGLDESRGAEVIIDCTGSAAVFGDVLSAASRFGKVILLGDTGFPDQQRLTSDVMTKGLTITATHESHDRDGWTQARIDERFFDLVQSRQFDLSGLLTHTFTPQQCREAYALVMERPEEALGIVFDWSGREV